MVRVRLRDGVLDVLLDRLVRLRHDCRRVSLQWQCRCKLLTVNSVFLGLIHVDRAALRRTCGGGCGDEGPRLTGKLDRERVDRFKVWTGCHLAGGCGAPGWGRARAVGGRRP